MGSSALQVLPSAKIPSQLSLRVILLCLHFRQVSRLIDGEGMRIAIAKSEGREILIFSSFRTVRQRMRMRDTHKRNAFQHFTLNLHNRVLCVGRGRHSMSPAEYKCSSIEIAFMQVVYLTTHRCIALHCMLHEQLNGWSSYRPRIEG